MKYYPIPKTGVNEEEIYVEETRSPPSPPRHADPPLQSGHELQSEGKEVRRMLFVAIARGVVKHLQQNVDYGLVVTYDAGYRANVDINTE